MTWDKNSPQGIESVSLGASRIRELKEDIEYILQQEHYFPVDNDMPVAYHKFRLLTTQQETETVNGQIWFNVETRQFSYKLGNVIKRNARYIEPNFSFVTLRMPTKGQKFWALQAVQHNYILGVDNNIHIHNGSDFFSLQHTHSISYANYEHKHQIRYKLGNAFGDTQGISFGTGTKTFSEGYKKHHPDEAVVETELNIEYHTHAIDNVVFSPAYYNCFVVRRK